MGKKETKDDQYLTTGCTLLDLVVGGGMGMGFPAGRVVNIVGDKSAGKSFLCAEMIAANRYALKKRFRWRYDDTETGFTFDTRELYGFEIDDPDAPTSTTVEEMDVNVGEFCKRAPTNSTGIYVVDSLDGLSDAEKEGQADEREKLAKAGKEVVNKGSYGMGVAKFLSQHFFKTRVSQLADNNTLMVVVSQVRENLDPFSFKKYTRGGGKALDFYCHTVLWLSNVAKLKRAGRTVGVVVNARTEKSKTPRPFRECNFVIYFDMGVDDIGSNLDYLYDLRGKDGQLLKASERIPWNNTEVGEAVSLASLREFLKEHDADKECSEARKVAEGNAALSVEWAREWIDKHPELAPKFGARFGDVYTRDALIDKIEADPKLVEELKKRVIDKWEGLEEASRGPERRRKYE